MTTFSTNTFESLKTAVLNMAGLPTIVTADCKKLERMIFEKTKLQVSETTLKRVFGFVYCKFNPSMYTINSLAKYCNYLGWEDFSSQQEKLAVKETAANADWDVLKYNANKITSFTLQALKNKSGIPYPLTIKRQFVDQHMDDFLESGHTATVFASPAGYGKTLALCHWIEEKQNTTPNDIILFFSSNALMNVFLTGRDMNSWMLALLGYTNEADMLALSDVQQRKEGNFYLVVDGIDEHMYKNDQFQVVLNQLADIFSFYQTQGWFKLILSMRSATWVNNRHNIELGQYSVHQGYQTQPDQATNVPLFNYSELNELCVKINPAIKHQISVDVLDTFQHPLYLQFYFKQNQAGFSLNNVDHTSIYDIISGFILDKVYMGNCSAEKILLINALVHEMDLKNRRYCISKINVINLAKQHVHAYNELLSLGFIKELNTSNNFKYEANIEFVSNHFLNFSITQYLLLQNNRLFDTHIINTINDLFDDTALPILKWCAYYAVKNEQLNNLQHLAEAKLKPNDKLELINFIGDLLRKEWTRQNKIAKLSLFFNQDCSDLLFNFIFGVENLGVDYVKTLQILLKFRLSERKKILIHTALALRSVLTLEMDKFAEHLNALKTYAAYDFEDFAINPLTCLNAIYNYYKHGIIDKNILAYLTKVLFNPAAFTFARTDSAENDLIYLIGVYTLKLAQNPVKNARFLHMLIKHYKPVSASVTLYNIMMNRLLAEEYLAVGKIETGMIYFNALNNAYNNDRSAFTPMMVSAFKCAKIITGFYSGFDGGSDVLHTIKMITTDHEYPNIKLYVLAFLFKYQRVLDPANPIYKQLSFDYARIIRDNGLHNIMFEQQQLG